MKLSLLLASIIFVNGIIVFSQAPAQQAAATAAAADKAKPAPVAVPPEQVQGMLDVLNSIQLKQVELTALRLQLDGLKKDILASTRGATKDSALWDLQRVGANWALVPPQTEDKKAK
jgi:hypothetical protein